MSEVLIKVDGVSKKFAKDLKQSLLYGVMDVFSGLRGSKKQNNLRKGEFWAVKDVSFEVKRGECLGLIGHNGAGKSTLLKTLNGLIAPDEGTIAMYGKVGALIELGAGFNPILTGRENIYNNAAVIGFSKKEINEKFDSIVEFSEIGDFLNMPVQNYSSGMKVRLGFAIAAQMEPDILIIDEVLAVGDLGFRVKCINRIQELLQKCAVIFVSHAMTQVSVVCTKLILMDHGQIEYTGKDIGSGIEKYFLKFGNDQQQQIIATKNISLKKVELFSDLSKQDEETAISSGSSLKVTFELEIDTEIKNLQFRLGIFNTDYRLLAEVDSDQVNFNTYNSSGWVKVSAVIENLYLRYGRYNIHLHVTDKDKKERILRQSNIATFVVKSTLSVGADFLLPSKWEEINN